jgi:hypothetical protein
LNGIPLTPTDNIYKFMAISGLWFFAGFIALYVWLINTQVQMDKELLRSKAYFFSVNMEQDIRVRLRSIENEKLDENRLDWVPSSFTQEQEKNFLAKALENHLESINKNKDVLHSNTGEELKLIERWDVKIVGTLYIILMVGLTWFGFSRWVTKTHRIDEELRILEKDINLKILQKLKLEINQIKRTNQLNSRSGRRTR